MQFYSGCSQNFKSNFPWECVMGCCFVFCCCFGVFLALVHCFYLHNHLSPRQATLAKLKAKMPCWWPSCSVFFRGGSSQWPVTTWSSCCVCTFSTGSALSEDLCPTLLSPLRVIILVPHIAHQQAMTNSQGKLLSLKFWLQPL